MADQLPRVSEILKVLDPDVYAQVPACVLDAAAARGTRLHGLACRHFASMLDLCAAPEVEAADRAAYEGLLDWIGKNRVRPVLLEERSVNRVYGYQGTPDVLVTYGPKQVLTLPDLKFTAALLPINFVQVAAYWHLPDYEAAKQAMLVHIDPTSGRWDDARVDPNGPEWAAFLSALNCWKWRAR